MPESQTPAAGAGSFQPLLEHLEAAVSGFAALDSSFHLVYANSAAVRMLGASRAALLGQRLWQVLPDECGSLQAAIRRVAITGAPEQLDYQLPGQGQWQLRLHPGEAGLSIWLNEMPPEQDASERALLGVSEVAHSLLESSQDCIKILDLDARLLYMSPYGRRTMGLESFTGVANSVWVDYWPGKGRQDAQDAVQMARQGGVGRFVGCSATMSGELRWWDSIVCPIYGEDGAPERLLAVSRDVTDYRGMQETLQQARELEMLGTLAGGVAQQFNNLLTPVLGYAAVLSKSLPPGEPLTAAAGIMRCARKAAALTSQLLEYSGRAVSCTGPLSLTKVVKDSSELLSSQTPAHITLEFDLASDLPLAVGDERQLRQMALKLLMNAVEAIDAAPGHIRIATRAGRFTPSGADAQEMLKPVEGACLEVTDTGCGMDEPTLRRVFDPFFTTKLPGRGLSLAAAYGLLRKQGGLLEASGKPGEGATLRIWLPLHRPQPAAEPSPSAAAHVGPLPVTVLVIDSEPRVRHVAVRILSLFGYSVLDAAGCQGGLDALAAHPEATTAVLEVAESIEATVQAYARIRTRYPELSIMLACSRQREAEVLAHSGFDGFAGFVFRPYDAVTLARVFKARPGVLE